MSLFVQDPRQSPKKSKHPEIDEVSFLHFNNPELLPWHPKYKDEMFPNLPNSVKHMIEEWLKGNTYLSILMVCGVQKQSIQSLDLDTIWTIIS